MLNQRTSPFPMKVLLANICPVGFNHIYKPAPVIQLLFFILNRSVHCRFALPIMAAYDARVEVKITF